MRELSERLKSAGTNAVLARAGEGNGASEFESIYSSYAPLLRRIAMFKFGVPRADADPLVHDVFATYLANPTNVRDLHPYLIGAICNASRQYLRRDASEGALQLRRLAGEKEGLCEVYRNAHCVLGQLSSSHPSSARTAHLQRPSRATGDGLRGCIG
jgi:hypothetical protein